MTLATINTDECFTTAEAAKKIGGVSPHTVTRYCLNHEEGKTPAIEAMRWGRTWLIHKDEINRFKKERRDPGRPPKEE